jgi:putative ABC transport system permease protein
MADHLREFAMLHTLGYSPLYLRSVVFAEMLLLILLAFVPAVVLALGVDAFIRAWTGWPLSYGLARFGIVLLLALALGMVAAWLALPWKLRRADPQDLF